MRSLLKPVLPEHRVGLAAFSLEMHGAEKQKTPRAVEKYLCLSFREQLQTAKNTESRGDWKGTLDSDLTACWSVDRYK